MKSLPTAIAAITTFMLAAGCGPTVPPVSDPSAPAPVTSTEPAPIPTASAVLKPGGLLLAVRAASHPGYDRLVFEFGGTVAPTVRIRYVDEVRADPSDRVIPLLGSAFLEVALDGGTLDTAPRESDPSKAQRYDGPTRLTPNLTLLKEVAVAGDFEGVLLFGVGLARPAGYRVETLTSPARVVIDFWYSPASAPASQSSR